MSGLCPGLSAESAVSPVSSVSAKSLVSPESSRVSDQLSTTSANYKFSEMFCQNVRPSRVLI